MSRETTIAIVTSAAMVAAIVLGLHVIVRYAGHRRRRLRWSGFWLTVVVAIALAPSTIADSGVAATYLLGVPVIAAAVPVIADMARVAPTVADAVGAIGVIGWALLLALGIGAAFLPGGFLLLVALAVHLKPSH